jgi:DNA-binding NtrC family response regulator
LVDEDDDGSRSLLQYIISLVLPDALVLEAASVADARAALAANAVTAVLTDCHLPDGTGLDGLGAARSADPTLPVLANSTDADFRAPMVAAGATSFFLKPFDMPQLTTVLLRLAGGPVTV